MAERVSPRNRALAGAATTSEARSIDDPGGVGAADLDSGRPVSDLCLQDLLLEDLLIEEVTLDGMCGVY